MDEIQKCRECLIYEDHHHDQYCRKLGLPEGSELMVYTLANGMFLEFDGLRIPLHSDYILCSAHKAAVDALEAA